MELKIISSEIESLASVATAMKKIKATDKKPAQQTTLDIAQKLARLNKNSTKKVISELENLKIARMTEEHIVAIATFLPQSPDELRTIFSGTKTTIKSEDLTRILDVVPKQ